MLQWEHSTILSTFIKLSFVIKTFVLSILSGLFYTGFTYLLHPATMTLAILLIQKGSFPPLSTGRIHFKFKGCEEVIYNLIQFSKICYVSKQCRTDQTLRSVASVLVLHCLLLLYNTNARPQLVLGLETSM